MTVSSFVSAFPPPDERLLAIAESLKPTLLETHIPVHQVIVVEHDESAILGWSKKPAPVERLEELPLLSSGDQCILDVGEHITGYLQFGLAGLPHEVEPADAPARIKLTFGEVLNDVAESFEPYNGFLSKSWLPEETVVLQKPHYKPQTMRIANRYAFRYIKIEVVATSIRFGLRFADMVATAVSSVGHANPCPLTFKSVDPALGVTDEQKSQLRRIDDAAMATLRDCMQTVYEDGPRRDQRLWIGDLRLQALAAYATYKDRDLVKRCLYLFAAMPFDDEGKLCACAYEEPEPHTGGNSIMDYALLYTNTLLDYVTDSGETVTGNDLYEIARQQFDIAARRIGLDFLYVVPIPKSLLGGSDWHFVDWHEKLEKSVAIQSIFIFALRALVDLASLLGKPEPTIALPDGSSLLASQLAIKLRSAVRESAFDGKVFRSGKERQLSWASNAWAVLAGVTDSQEEAQVALRRAYEDESSIQGNTPYLHHYLCEAFIKAGLTDLALKHILHYWGSMIDAGADTFFECWIPSQPRFSPYGAFSSQSFCHAWSCTPALLLRQLGMQ
ncbi:hypothetical protein JCM10908_001865 [Rhodotorula pacifica]|uniref:uncharacterized protein n=1 Tax=Rhodotorula pacifica TaxID=1495444 RepID=UPI00318211C5